MIQATTKAQRGLVAVITPLIVMLSSIGCDSLLEVELPGDIALERTTDPDLAVLITNSVLSTLECAVSSHHAASGLFGTEMQHGSGVSSTGLGYRSPNAGGQNFTCIDRDDLGVSNSGAQYVAMANGRDMTRVVEDAIADGSPYPNANFHLAYRAIYTAYAMTIFGEAHCGAVLEPIGPLLQPAQVLTEAEVWFTKGLVAAQAAGETTAVNLAMLGRARVRLALGKMAEASADAAAVPPGFVFHVTRAGTPVTRNNIVWKFTWKTKSWTIDPMWQNLTVQGVPDPRVEVQDMETATLDGFLPLFNPVKYQDNDAQERMASWEEAQLIIAEAELGQTAVDRINAVRQTHTGLPLYTPVDVNDDDEILNQVIEDRAREFFLEGRVFADMVRFRDTGKTVGLIEFQEGFEPRRIYTYQPIYCMPVPAREFENNPNVTIPT